MDDTSPGTTRVPTAHEPGEDAQTMDAVQDPLRDSSVSSTSDGLMDPAEVSAPELDGPQQRSSNDASPASEDSELMCLASPPHHMRDAFANNDEDTDDELRNDAAALRRENTANDERNVLPLFSPLEEPDGEYDEDPEVAGGDSAESLMLPAHILRQIELLNAEVEQDPKSIWMQGNRVFAPRSILDIDEALEAEAAASVPASTARTRHPSSAVTMHDLSPPADMDVMFGWPPELEEAVEDRRRLWANVLGEEEAEASPKTGSQRLRDELLHFGPPKSIRRVVWRSVASLEELSIETLFRQLKEDNSPFEKLISRDVPRTFPKLGMFREDAGPGQELLGNVLKAYSVYDGEVGYCQGMSFVVAGLLIVGVSPWKLSDTVGKATNCSTSFLVG